MQNPPATPHDDHVVVYDSDALQPCADRALVLHSLGIPYEILRDGYRAALAVPAEFAERARFELWQYERENRPSQRRPAEIVYRNGLPGAVAYGLVISACAWLAGENFLGRDWLAAGRIDGGLVRHGEWWRLVTALTLHGSLRHLLGNLGFGVLFSFLAGRLVGPGIAWFGILAASIAANGMNTLLLDPGHRSIGASTAVFAALGLVSGFVWRSRLMVQDRWPFRLGPIVGGIALLAFTGTGDETTDIGAHLAGFVCGFGMGLLFTRLPETALARGVQLACGVAVLAIVAGAWLLAFAAPPGG